MGSVSPFMRRLGSNPGRVQQGPTVLLPFSFRSCDAPDIPSNQEGKAIESASVFNIIITCVLD